MMDFIGFGRIRMVDDGGSVQLLQVDEGKSDRSGMRRLIDRVFKMAQFGFVSVPPLGSETVMVRIAGDRSSSIAVATNHQASRVRNLQPGDAAMHDVRGQIVKLSDGGFEVDCAGLPCRIVNAEAVTIVSSGAVTIDAPSVHVAGPLTVEGSVTATEFIQG